MTKLHVRAVYSKCTCSSCWSKFVRQYGPFWYIFGYWGSLYPPYMRNAYEPAMPASLICWRRLGLDKGRSQEFVSEGDKTGGLGTEDTQRGPG